MSGKQLSSAPAKTTKNIDLTAQTMSRLRTYAYTSLKDARANTTINVFAVVKFFKSAEKTRGSDYYMLLSLVDESMYRPADADSGSCKLKCLLFSPSEDGLPKDVKAGDIVRLHRLKISRYRGELQGQSGPGFSWLVFGGGVDSPLIPSAANSSSYTLTDENRERVKALRQWGSSYSGSQSVLREKPLELTLSQIGLEKFFDLTCQVVSTCALPNETCLLRVWDGTKPALQLYEEDTRKDALDLKTDHCLYASALGYMADVIVYRSHYDAASKVQPGDFVKLVNLHATGHKEQGGQTTATALPLARLCLHDNGEQFGRDLKLLDSACDKVVKLQHLLNEAAARQEANEDNDSLLSWLSLSGESDRVDSADEESAREPSSTVDRCMLHTATVIRDHHHIPATSLRDIQHQKPPNKYRVYAQIVDYQPRVANPRKFVRLVCNECNFVTRIPMNKKQRKRLRQLKRDGIVQYRCPACPCNDSVNVLQFTYMLQLVLYDGTAYLTAQLWKKEAEHFFHDTPAVNLLRDRERYNALYEELHQMSPVVAENELEDCPWAELCLMSYTTQHGTCYQIFDTTLSAPE